MDSPRLILTIELETEEDGRWIADVLEIPGVTVYGATKREALAKIKRLALEVVTDRLERGEDLLTGIALGDSCPPEQYAADFAGLGFLTAAMAR